MPRKKIIKEEPVVKEPAKKNISVKEKKSAGPWVSFIVVLLILVIIGSVFFYNQYKMSKEVKNFSEQFSQEATNKLSELENQMSGLQTELQKTLQEQENSLIDDSEESDLNSFTYNSLNFEYPKNWIEEKQERESGISIIFRDESKNQKAELSCPILATGFEQSDIEKKSRNLKKQDQEFTAEFWDAQAQDEEGKDFVAILFYNTEDQSLESCSIYAEVKNDNDFQIYEEIYDSIQ